MNEITARVFGQFGWVGVVALAVILLLRGYLIPRKTLDGIVSSYDKQIADLQAALKTREESNAKLLEQQNALLQLAFFSTKAATEANNVQR